MNYSADPGECRCDYFKPSGKWYMTEVIDMNEFYDEPDVYLAVRKAIVATNDTAGYKDRGVHLLEQFTAVVADPYHRNSFPIMLVPTKRSDLQR